MDNTPPSRKSRSLRPGSRTSWPPGLSLALVFVLLLSACGAAAADDGSDSGSSGGIATLADDAPSPDDSAGNDATSDDVADTETQLLAFSACMRENGVDMEDPTVDAEGNVQFGRQPGAAIGGQGGVSREEQQAAQEACGELLEGIQLGGGERVDQTELEDQLLEYTSCMRDNGYDMPDPDFSDNGHSGAGPFGDAIDTDDPAFKTAAQSCDGIIGG